ncbi:AT-rich interactive domain-containing protein 3-like isoform X2 [Tripterygium wilfordii]|uniref:AT-rich interactive domain-containing protein 3-like isoform X2 n=1 Tax=Tripterygium wilfordii TaxID=458696 RepID=UPI0018F84D4B|nr:AT-rich interactive domain-containing protein 3-like isoform X2 [Tripterygium wilfordii]
MGDPKESAESGQDTSVFLAKDQPFVGQHAQTEQLDCDSPLKIDSSFPSYNGNATIRTAELVVDGEDLESESFPCQPHQDAPFPLSPDNNELGPIKPDREFLDAEVTDGVKSEAHEAIDSKIDADEYSIVPISYVEVAEHHDRHSEPSTDAPISDSSDPTKHVVYGQDDPSKVTADTNTEAHEVATHAKLEACELAARATTQIYEPVEDTKIEAYEPSAKTESGEAAKNATHKLCQSTRNNCLPTLDAKTEASEVHKSLASEGPSTPNRGSYDVKNQIELRRELSNGVNIMEISTTTNNGHSSSKYSFLFDENYMIDGSESGTEEEQSAFMQELDKFFRERSMEFKPPKFYGEGLNCLKLWRAVMRLGGYDKACLLYISLSFSYNLLHTTKVTSCKLWRQVGESFKPPKTCTTVSWTFRGFYEKALLDYERHKTQGGELSMSVSVATHSEPMNVDSQAAGSGRARRESATRAMQGWHSQRLLGNGEVSDPIIKDKNSISLQKREKQQKNLGLLKRKKPSTYVENSAKAARVKTTKPQLDIAVVDVGPPADWVKINVQKTKDCFEIYALVPGLLREEVRVQSDPGGRLVISGEPEHTDNPWGVAPFKKVVSLPSRIDPHQTSAVVTLHGQLFVRVPFEQSE